MSEPMIHPIERIRDAFARAHARVMGHTDGKVSSHYMTIPPNRERDVDLILNDAIDELESLRARVAELEREVERVRRQNEIAHRALAEAASRFAAKDMEGVRLLLCDRNAQSNAAALAPRAEVKP